MYFNESSLVYVDGRPAPPMKGQLRRKQEREVLAVSVFFPPPPIFTFKSFSVCQTRCPFSQRRIVMLNAEVDRGMEAWRENQEEAKRMEEHKKSLLLQPKGKLLMKKKSQS